MDWIAPLTPATQSLHCYHLLSPPSNYYVAVYFVYKRFQSHTPGFYSPRGKIHSIFFYFSNGHSYSLEFTVLYVLVPHILRLLVS